MYLSLLERNRKVLDSVEIREKIKAAVVDEAHLIAEWQQVLYYFFSQ